MSDTTTIALPTHPRTVIATPGIYDMSPEEYHADPCPEPSLSRGIAHLIHDRSPLHAHHAHPRLGGNGGIVASKAMDAGSAVHSLMLDKGDGIVTLKGRYGPKHKLAGLPFRDFKTDAARDERDALREAGHIPVLEHELSDIHRSVAAIARNLRWHQDGPDFFAPGRSEAVVIWREGDTWLRCMVDRLPDDPTAPPYDLKLTEMSAAPGGSWERRLQSLYAFQDAFYRRGIKAVRGILPPPMRFVVVERDAPHGVSVMAAAPSLQDVAERQVERAIKVWRQCLADDRWPGYSPFTAHVEAPAWMVSAEDERELREEMMTEFEQ
jgi:hypothetical protein